MYFHCQCYGEMFLYMDICPDGSSSFKGKFSLHLHQAIDKPVYIRSEHNVIMSQSAASTELLPVHQSFIFLKLPCTQNIALLFTFSTYMLCNCMCRKYVLWKYQMTLANYLTTTLDGVSLCLSEIVCTKCEFG